MNNWDALKLYICFGFEEQVSESEVKPINGALFLRYFWVSA